jgi:hypothetical protein
LGADDGNGKAKRLAEVDQGICVGNLSRESGKERGKIGIYVLNALLNVALSLSKEELLWWKDRELALIDAILLHVVFHFIHEYLVEIKELRVPLHNTVFDTLLGKEALIFPLLGCKVALDFEHFLIHSVLLLRD